MRTLILIITVLLTGFSAFAQTGQQEQAETFYREGKYQEAAQVYKNILAEGKESSALYYNLGNCYYKLGENTQAILNYERALLLDPSDGMARYNLKMAEKGIVDKIEVLPELFFVRWFKAVETYFSADQWGTISVVLFIFFLCMAALFFYAGTVGWKKTGFWVGVVALFFTATTLFFAVKQHHRITNREYAIITASSVTVKGAPDNSGTALFLIHEGLKVRVIGTLGNWYNIRVADGNEGWVEKSELEKI